MTVDRIARAAAFIAIAESGDAKREAYERAADEILLARREDPTLTWRQIGARLGRHERLPRELVAWREEGREGLPHSDAAHGRDRNAVGARKIAREQPDVFADAFAKAPPEQQRKIADAIASTPARKVLREATEDDQDRRARERMEAANERKGQIGTPLALYRQRLIRRFDDWCSGLRWLRDELGDLPSEQLQIALDQHRRLLDQTQENIGAIEALMDVTQATPEDVIEGTASRSPRRELGA